MADALRDEFERAAKYLKEYLPSNISMSDNQKLRSYGLFKQIEIGDVNTDRPGMFSPVNRAKWYHQADCIDNMYRDAWKACEGMDKDAAMQAYVDLVTEVSPDWRSTEMN